MRSGNTAIMHAGVGQRTHALSTAAAAAEFALLLLIALLEIVPLSGGDVIFIEFMYYDPYEMTSGDSNNRNHRVRSPSQVVIVSFSSSCNSFRSNPIDSRRARIQATFSLCVSFDKT